MRRLLVRGLLVGTVLVVLAGCAPPLPLRLPTLYQGQYSGGLETEVAPLECADVHAVLRLPSTFFIEDQASGEIIGQSGGEIEVDFCRPEGDGSNFDVAGRMAFTCCTSEPGTVGDHVFSGPARVRRSGDQLSVDVDIEQGTHGYRGATGVCRLDASVMYGNPDPPPPSHLTVMGGFTCRIGGPDGPPPPPSFSIRTWELPEAVRDQPYLAVVEAAGGTPPYRWRMTGLPAGLTSRDGAIFGASTEPGESAVEVTVRDAVGLTRSATLILWTQNPDVVGSIEALSTDDRLGPGAEVAVSDDGEVVAFISDAVGLTDPPGRPSTADVFVWDRATDVLRRITDDTFDQHYDIRISGDGSTVVFRTYQALVPEDTNRDLDIYLADASTGAITRVSPDRADTSNEVSTDGQQVFFTEGRTDPDGNTRISVSVWDRATGAVTSIADGNDFTCCLDLSDDGSRVTMISEASDLVPGDTNGRADVFVIDRPNGRISRLDTGSGDIWGARISGDGTTVAVVSEGTGFLPPGETDTNGGGDLFRADVDTGAIVRLTNGDAPTDAIPSISDDGRAIAFASDATDIAAGERDTGRSRDLFLWNGETGLISRLTRSRSPAAGISMVEVSGDGRTIHFTSNATDLDPDAPAFTPDASYLYRWVR